MQDFDHFLVTFKTILCARAGLCIPTHVSLKMNYIKTSINIFCEMYSCKKSTGNSALIKEKCWITLKRGTISRPNCLFLIKKNHKNVLRNILPYQPALEVYPKLTAIIISTWLPAEKSKGNCSGLSCRLVIRIWSIWCPAKAMSLSHFTVCIIVFSFFCFFLLSIPRKPVESQTNISQLMERKTCVSSVLFPFHRTSLSVCLILIFQSYKYKLLW